MNSIRIIVLSFLIISTGMHPAYAKFSHWTVNELDSLAQALPLAIIHDWEKQDTLTLAGDSNAAYRTLSMKVLNNLSSGNRTLIGQVMAVDTVKTISVPFLPVYKKICLLRRSERITPYYGTIKSLIY